MIKLILLAGTLTVLLTGCASEKPKPVSERGWIGGEYVLAKPSSFLLVLDGARGTVGSYPRSLLPVQKAAILITKLSTNAPAARAGLRPGDLILELNHQPMTRWADFRRTIDQSQPGTNLAIRAYRDGKNLDFTIPVGREKFRAGGCFTIAFPTVVHPWKLWPDTGLSLVFLGYDVNPGVRHDLGDSKQTYDDEWTAYLGLFEVTKGERVVAQE